MAPSSSPGRHHLGACTCSLLVFAPCTFPFADFNWDPFAVVRHNCICERNSLRVVLETPDTQASQCLLDPHSPLESCLHFLLLAVFFQAEKKAIFSVFIHFFPPTFSKSFLWPSTVLPYFYHNKKRPG